MFTTSNIIDRSFHRDLVGTNLLHPLALDTLFSPPPSQRSQRISLSNVVKYVFFASLFERGVPQLGTLPLALLEEMCSRKWGSRSDLHPSLIGSWGPRTPPCPAGRHRNNRADTGTIRETTEQPSPQGCWRHPQTQA